MSWVLTALLGCALVVAQVLFGGVHMAHAQLAYAIVGIAGLSSALVIRARKISPDGWCVGTAALFFGYVTLRAALSPVAHLARYDWMLALACASVYAITAFCVIDPRQRMAILVALLALVAVHLWVGLVQFTREGGFLLWGEVRHASYGRRASGLFVCPNHLAGALEVVALLGLSMVLWGRGPFWGKILVCYASLMALCGVALTGSRGGYLSLAFGAAILVVTSLYVVWRAMPELFARRLLVLLGFAALVGVGGVAMVSRSDLLRDRASRIVEVDVRPLLWRAGMEQFRQAPVLGTGARSYVYFGRRHRDPSVQLDPVFAHNDYVQLLAEYGLIGAALAAAFVVAHVRRGCKSVGWAVANRLPYAQRMQSDALALGIGALAAVGAFLVHSVVDFNLHVPANALLLAFVGGILANSGWVQPESKRRARAWPMAARAVVPVAALALLVPVAGQWSAERHHWAALREYDARRYTMAIDQVRRGLRSRSHDPELHFLMGLSRMGLAGGQSNGYLRTSMTEAAASSFRRAAALYPQDVRIWLKLGQALDELRRFGEAWQAYGEALRLDPKLHRVLERVGFHFQREGRLDEARRYYEEARRLRASAISLAGLRDIEEAERRGRTSPK